MNTANSIHFLHRFYDPRAKRFLTPDSYLLENVDEMIKRPAEMNLYSYAGNNPLVNVDPQGNQSMTTMLLAVASVSAAMIHLAREFDKDYKRHEAAHEKFKVTGDKKAAQQSLKDGAHMMQNLDKNTKDVVEKTYKAYGDIVKGQGGSSPNVVEEGLKQAQTELKNTINETTENKVQEVQENMNDVESDLSVDQDE